MIYFLGGTGAALIAYGFWTLWKIVEAPDPEDELGEEHDGI